VIGGVSGRKGRKNGNTKREKKTYHSKQETERDVGIRNKLEATLLLKGAQVDFVVSEKGGCS